LKKEIGKENDGAKLCEWKGLLSGGAESGALRERRIADVLRNKKPVFGVGKRRGVCGEGGLYTSYGWIRLPWR